KAHNLNEVTIPELRRMASGEKPFFLFLRHLDPHSPYLPPPPFDRMFYGGNEFDPNNRSLEKVYAFKPFRDYFLTWFPPGCTDAEYIIAQYDGSLAYMDACIQRLIAEVAALGIEEETLIVLTGDHGETLMEHECYFDHHGLYECTINVPLIIKFPEKVPGGLVFDEYVQQKDIMPTILELLGITAPNAFDGRSLVPVMQCMYHELEPEIYLTEATWMRKHGWRTPEWKLIEALEPDFHFKPRVELYNLVRDPEERVNVAEQEPEVVAMMMTRMRRHIERRVRETGRPNPIETRTDWNWKGVTFTSSQHAYDLQHIGDPEAARKLQEQSKTNK
ncbi:MAG TPA: sulfatase, partial [Clostridiales bacterium]|nr:sulfatase [Clostridiales bacterium]